MKTVAVTGSFDNLRSKHVRFLEEASKLGNVHVALWSDEACQAADGRPPRFPQQERLYLLQSLRFVENVTLVSGIIDPNERNGIKPDLWVFESENDPARKHMNIENLRVPYRVISDADLRGLQVPAFAPAASDPMRKKVIVTGCYDWFHSGHVRFFEEASALGDLYVVVGHDANIALLKGHGHPLLPQAERLYMVHAVRHVHQAMISTGRGWLDAEPEIALIKPDFYMVNEDGDKPEKKAFCMSHNIQYVVLKRIPKQGLPKRESTVLRGF
jgi:cytidyltransferase-like protein